MREITINQVNFQGGDILSTTFIFILHAWERAYLSIASIYKVVKMELEVRIYIEDLGKPEGMVFDSCGFLLTQKGAEICRM